MLRRLLGLSAPSAGDTDPTIEHALGPARSWQRAELFGRAEGVLGATLRQEQRDRVRSLATDVVEAVAVPGAGKTALIEVLVIMVLLNSTNIKLLIAEPTRDMCAALEARLRQSAKQAGFERVVARIGQCPDSLEDHMGKFLQEHLPDLTTAGDAALAAVDRCVELLPGNFGEEILFSVLENVGLEVDMRSFRTGLPLSFLIPINFL